LQFPWYLKLETSLCNRKLVKRQKTSLFELHWLSFLLAVNVVQPVSMYKLHLPYMWSTSYVDSAAFSLLSVSDPIKQQAMKCSLHSHSVTENLLCLLSSDPPYTFGFINLYGLSWFCSSHCKLNITALAPQNRSGVFGSTSGRYFQWLLCHSSLLWKCE